MHLADETVLFEELSDLELSGVKGGAVSNADSATLDNAVNIYNALTAVIRDVVLKAKLTPIGGTEDIN